MVYMTFREFAGLILEKPPCLLTVYPVIIKIFSQRWVIRPERDHVVLHVRLYSNILVQLDFQVDSEQIS